MWSANNSRSSSGLTRVALQPAFTLSCPALAGTKRVFKVGFDDQEDAHRWHCALLKALQALGPDAMHGPVPEDTPWFKEAEASDDTEPSMPPSSFVSHTHPSCCCSVHGCVMLMCDLGTMLQAEDAQDHKQQATMRIGLAGATLHTSFVWT